MDSDKRLFDFPSRNDARVPERLRKAFWDTNFDALDVEKHKTFIIPRLLTKGGNDGFVWVLERYSIEALREAAVRSRDLTPVLANFFQQCLGLTREEMAYYQTPKIGWK